MSDETARRGRLALAAASGQTAIAVVNYFFARDAVMNIGPTEVATLRFAGTAGVMAILLLLLGPHRQNRPWPGRDDLLAIAGLGMIGVSINQWLFVTGLSLTSPARAALFYSLTPSFVYGISVLRGEECWSRRRGAGIVLALAGVLVVIGARGAFDARSLVGDGVLLLAAALWSVYTAFGKGLIVRHGAFPVTGLALLFGSVAFLPVGLSTLQGWDPHQFPARVWGDLLYMVLANTVVAYMLWYQAVRWLPASRVAVFNNLQPPLTVALGALAWGETVTMPFLAGASLALLGVIWTQRS